MLHTKKWEIKEINASPGEIRAISDSLGITTLTASLLCQRGYKDPESARRFIQKESVLFHDPFLMPDMDKACRRINKAISESERIMIYGDYDVDGVTSVSTLYMYLKSRGADAGYYIPNRNGEGYGVNTSALEQFAQDGVSLIITVDTGTTSVNEIAYASTLGMDVIVTDHHECHAELPEAAAVVNPRRSDCEYPYRELAGVGVVFKLISALEKLEHGEEGDYLRGICEEYIDLAALGTVADVMPLTDENRLIVSLGLHYIQNTSRPGLKALIEESAGSSRSKPQRKINSSTVGYTLAPRINAAGRISSALEAVKLFLTQSEEEAKNIAEKLCSTNRQRQEEENKIAVEAYKKIESEHDFEHDKVIVLDSDHWHHGVIGIVASRITEKYHLPCILISFENGIGKGSGRSIKGMNLVEGLSFCGDLLDKYGGHELAAGLSISRENVDKFRRRINEYASENISESDLVSTISVDMELSSEDITVEQADELDCLEPYGTANPVPVFLIRDAVLLELTPIGNNRHSRMVFEKNGKVFYAVAFGMIADELDFVRGEKLCIVGNLNINDFQGTKNVQIIVRDISCCEETEKALIAAGERYEKIHNGETILKTENILPSRDDFKKVYLFLKKSIQTGKDVHTVHSIHSEINDVSLSPEKIQFIIDIFNETRVFGIEMLSSSGEENGFGHNRMRFKMSFSNSKVNLEKSSIYKWIKSRIEK